ncbi:unnamed protein product [Sympodiomycopsis kandeliae]
MAEQLRASSVTPVLRCHGVDFSRAESVRPSSQAFATKPSAPAPALSRIKKEDSCNGLMLPPALVPNSKSSTSAVNKSSATHAIKRIKSTCPQLKSSYLSPFRARSRTPSIAPYRRSVSRAPASRANSIAPPPPPPPQSQQEQEQRGQRQETVDCSQRDQQQQREETISGSHNGVNDNQEREQQQQQQQRERERRKAVANAIDLDEYPSSSSEDDNDDQQDSDGDDHNRMDRDDPDRMDRDDDDDEEEDQGRPILLHSPTPEARVPSPTYQDLTRSRSRSRSPPPCLQRNIRVTVVYAIQQVILPTDPSSSTSQIEYEDLHRSKTSTDPFFTTTFDTPQARRQFDGVKFDEELKRFCQRKLN